MLLDKSKIQLSLMIALIKINSDRETYEKVIDVWRNSSRHIYGDVQDSRHWNLLKILLCNEMAMTSSEGDILLTSLYEADQNGIDIKTYHDHDYEIIVKSKNSDKKNNVFPFRKS